MKWRCSTINLANFGLTYTSVYKRDNSSNFTRFHENLGETKQAKSHCKQKCPLPMCAIAVVAKLGNTSLHVIVFEPHTTESCIWIQKLSLKSSQSTLHETPSSAKLWTRDSKKKKCDQFEYSLKKETEDFKNLSTHSPTLKILCYSSLWERSVL